MMSFLNPDISYSSAFGRGEEIDAPGDGGEGRNRTDEWGFCRAQPYHLATSPSFEKGINMGSEGFEPPTNSV